MASSFFENSLDLDVVFAPLEAGMTPVSATGFQVNGVDLAQRYAPLSYGSAAPHNTGYAIANGTDLTGVFAKLGSTTLTVTVQPSPISGSAAAGTPNGTVTSSAAMTCSVSGGVPPYTYAWSVSGGASANSPSSPTTLISATVNAQSTLPGNAFCHISDSGGHSVNTNNAAYSLTNTSINSVSFSFRATLFTAPLLPAPSGSSIGYQSPTFYGTGSPRNAATPEPVTTPSGSDILASILWNGTPGPGGTLYFTLYASDSVVLTQAFLTTLNIAGLSLSGASATFSHSPSTLYATWAWVLSAQPFIAGTIYSGNFIFS